MSPPNLSADQLAPHSVEAEEATIGAALLRPDVAPALLDIVDPDDFFVVHNARIWAAIRDLSLRNAPIDYITVIDELAANNQEWGDPAYILGLTNRTPSSLNAEGYAAIVARDAVRRRLILAAGEIARIAHTESIRDPGDLVAMAEERVMAVAQTAAMRDPSWREILSCNVSGLQDRMKNPGLAVGYQVGLVDVDRVIGGFRPGDLVIIAGSTGMGKTSLLLQIAAHNCAAGIPAALISLEMGEDALAGRIVSAKTGIDLWNIRNAQLSAEDLEKYLACTPGIEGWTLKMPPDVHTIEQLELRTRRYVSELGVRLVIVDYLQLLRSSAFRAGQRVQEVSDISRRLKLLAVETGTTIIAGSQLSRAWASRHDKRPALSDLRESGSIEQDSDIVLFIYREALNDPGALVGDAAEIIIAKHRNGPTGAVQVYWDGPHATFKNAVKTKIDLGRI